MPIVAEAGDALQCDAAPLEQPRPKAKLLFGGGDDEQPDVIVYNDNDREDDHKIVSMPLNSSLYGEVTPTGDMHDEANGSTGNGIKLSLVAKRNQKT